jgi:hypothetical protein
MTYVGCILRTISIKTWRVYPAYIHLWTCKCTKYSEGYEVAWACVKILHQRESLAGYTFVEFDTESVCELYRLGTIHPHTMIVLVSPIGRSGIRLSLNLVDIMSHRLTLRTSWQHFPISPFWAAVSKASSIRELASGH